MIIKHWWSQDTKDRGGKSEKDSDMNQNMPDHKNTSLLLSKLLKKC